MTIQKVGKIPPSWKQTVWVGALWTDIDDHRSITDAMMLDSITFVPRMTFTQTPWARTWSSNDAATLRVQACKTKVLTQSSTAAGTEHVAVPSCSSEINAHDLIEVGLGGVAEICHDAVLRS